MAEVRVFRPDEWRKYREIRLASLIDAPDAFGATWEESSSRADKEWQARLAGVDPTLHFPVAAFVGGEPVALAWGRIDPADPSVAILNQMWTSPSARGQGLGAKLLRAVIDWSRETSASTICLEVTIGNDAARRLYESVGFVATGRTEPLREGSDKLVEEMVFRRDSSGTS